jgi:hypothetical protein
MANFPKLKSIGDLRLINSIKNIVVIQMIMLVKL